MNKRIKYNVVVTKINDKGKKIKKQEPWTGIFKSEEEANKWYNEYRIQHEADGHKLIRVGV